VIQKIPKSDWRSKSAEVSGFIFHPSSDGINSPKPKAVIAFGAEYSKED
jgi:hypothetical protein